MGTQKAWAGRKHGQVKSMDRSGRGYRDVASSSRRSGNQVCLYSRGAAVLKSATERGSAFPKFATVQASPGH